MSSPSSREGIHSNVADFTVGVQARWSSRPFPTLPELLLVGRGEAGGSLGRSHHGAAHVEGGRTELVVAVGGALVVRPAMLTDTPGGEGRHYVCGYHFSWERGVNHVSNHSSSVCCSQVEISQEGLVDANLERFQDKYFRLGENPTLNMGKFRVARPRQ